MIRLRARSSGCDSDRGRDPLRKLRRGGRFPLVEAEDRIDTPAFSLSRSAAARAGEDVDREDAAQRLAPGNADLDCVGRRRQLTAQMFSVTRK